MRNPAWVTVTPGVPIVSDFGTTSGQGTPICIDATTDQGYYLDAFGVVTAMAGGGGGGAILEIDGGTASNTGTPYITVEGGTA